jgi:hypothetical protein
MSENDKPDRKPPSLFARWAQRKDDVRRAEVPTPQAVADSTAPLSKSNIDESSQAKLLGKPLESMTFEVSSTSRPGVREAEAQQVSDATTLEKNPLPAIEDLTTESDFTRFMQADVPAPIRNAALKKMFSDPHFNVMDMLDTYVDDYSKSEPIPLDMLQKLVQTRALKLFGEEKTEQVVKAEPDSVGLPTESTQILSDAASPPPEIAAPVQVAGSDEALSNDAAQVGAERVQNPVENLRIGSK